jgi:hypothetical protein
MTDPSHPVTRAELERELAHLRELLTERDKALLLQATEYERRLDLLNHEHARAAENWRLSLPRERYEADVRAQTARLVAWIMGVIAALSLVLQVLGLSHGK